MSQQPLLMCIPWELRGPEDEYRQTICGWCAAAIGIPNIAESTLVETGALPVCVRCVFVYQLEHNVDLTVTDRMRQELHAQGVSDQEIDGAIAAIAALSPNHEDGTG